jgi:predicted cupin superfamily sugar epimerase
MDKAQYWISLLKLIPHPEGGFFREIYSSMLYVDGNLLSSEFNGRRNLSTAFIFC